MKIGDKVRCPYGITGIIEGSCSPDMMLVKVTIDKYTKKGKRYVKEKIKQIHIYSICVLENI